MICFLCAFWTGQVLFNCDYRCSIHNWSKCRRYQPWALSWYGLCRVNMKVKVARMKEDGLTGALKMCKSNSNSDIEKEHLTTIRGIW